MWGLLFYRPLPTVDGTYRFLGLDRSAEVVRDALGTAHVYARDAHDLYLLQGYVTAQDRLVQMEELRAEARGSAAQTARQAYVRASPALRGALDAYAQGVTKLVDQYARAGALPGELVLAGWHPGAWEPADSLAIATARLERLGPASVCAAAAASRTFKGRPILAADLYGDVADPGWYEIGIDDGLDTRAVGVSLPGVPGIVAGHNGWVAWALLPSARPRFAPDATVGSLLEAMSARTAASFARSMTRSAVAACVADVAGLEGASDLGRSAFLPPGRGEIVAGERAGLQDMSARLDRARGIDVEGMRLLLGRPLRTLAGARVIVDLAEVDTSRIALSQGISGQRASAHYRDQAPLWETGQVRALPFSRPALAPVEGRLVLRPS